MDDSVHVCGVATLCDHNEEFLLVQIKARSIHYIAYVWYAINPDVTRNFSVEDNRANIVRNI